MAIRKVKAGLVPLVVAAGTLGATSVVAAGDKGDSTEPLSILLTNDDGWDAPGITAVYDALVAAGHDVTLVAPATNQSGIGAQVTFRGELTVIRHAENQYSVSGTPADATEVGLSVLFAKEPPDLVVSGTNVGENIATAAIHSGTVGAAATALKDGVPAIAISTEIDRGPRIGPYEDTAEWLVDLLDQLQGRSEGAILPDGVGLNINYPVVGSAATGFQEPEGVAWTVMGTGFLDVDYVGTLSADGTPSTLTIDNVMGIPETTKNADSTALAADLISVSPMEGDYDASPQGLGRLRNIVGSGG